MKRIGLVSLVIASVFCLAPQVANADVWVDGYYRSDGTWVRGHYRSDPNGYFWDNYSSYGNINPYTGGNKDPDFRVFSKMSNFHGKSRFSCLRTFAIGLH